MFGLIVVLKAFGSWFVTDGSEQKRFVFTAVLNELGSLFLTDGSAGWTVNRSYDGILVLIRYWRNWDVVSLLISFWWVKSSTWCTWIVCTDPSFWTPSSCPGIAGPVLQICVASCSWISGMEEKIVSVSGSVLVTAFFHQKKALYVPIFFLPFIISS